MGFFLICAGCGAKNRNINRNIRQNAKQVETVPIPALSGRKKASCTLAVFDGITLKNVFVQPLHSDMHLHSDK